MYCEHCCGLEKIFNEREARRELRNYERKGAPKSTQLLVDALKKAGVAGSNLLDIGGGIGIIQHELIPAGVRSVHNVEASSAYIKISREEAERSGFSDRVEYKFGNFVELAGEVESTDIVTLDRVICCYPDMKSLVGLSAEKAKKLFGVVFPRDTWWIKLAVGAFNRVYPLLSGTGYKSYVHPTSTFDEILKARGFTRRFFQKTMIWQVMVYARG